MKKLLAFLENIRMLILVCGYMLGKLALLFLMAVAAASIAAMFYAIGLLFKLFNFITGRPL